MDAAFRDLAVALRERLLIIADEASRRDTSRHVARLKDVSERIGELAQRLPGTVDPQLDEYLRAYGEAMALYRGGQFPAARARFEQAHALRPDETLALLFAVRCTALEEGAPIPNWDGIFVMTEK